MNKHCKQDEDLREIEHECITESISLNLMDAKTILFEEALVTLKCFFITKNFCPELQLDNKVEDEQCLSIKEDEEPEYATWPLLFQHAVSENRNRVYHVKPASFHQSCQDHHHIAK